MEDYPGEITVRGKHYFIDRYVGILKTVRYPKWGEIESFGNEMWEKVKDLPQSFNHCDLYVGNIHTTDTGKMYIVDFDTACMSFSGYDIILFCNGTPYFDFDPEGYGETKRRLEKFLPGYLRINALDEKIISGLYPMLGIYHYQLQASVLEKAGYDACSFEFFDRQLDWLQRWKAQCLEMGTW
jgi:Ser/Thr protein kinase RdoA (MazF antagonist)